MEPIKIMSTASQMSNLVGMYAFKVENGKILARVFIAGKADNTYFIVQAISPLTGEPNIAKLMTLDELRDWVIIPKQDIANEILKDYDKNGWRYDFPVKFNTRKISEMTKKSEPEAKTSKNYTALEMISIEPGLKISKEFVEKENIRAKKETVYWAHVWIKSKNLHYTYVGWGARKKELRSRKCFDTWLNYLKSLAVNCI